MSRCSPNRGVDRVYRSREAVLADASNGIHFNVTHTDGLALIALARRPVGVDVEQLRAVSDPEGLVRRFFSAAERDSYRVCPPNYRTRGSSAAGRARKPSSKPVD